MSASTFGLLSSREKVTVKVKWERKKECECICEREKERERNAWLLVVHWASSEIQNHALITLQNRDPGFEWILETLFLWLPGFRSLITISSRRQGIRVKYRAREGGETPRSACHHYGFTCTQVSTLVSQAQSSTWCNLFFHRQSVKSLLCRDPPCVLVPELGFQCTSRKLLSFIVAVIFHV